MTFFNILLLIFCISLSFSKTPEEWKTRAIYQLMTDRFAKDDLNTTTECKDLLKYCGGNYKGLINKLDYIQNLGYNAIWISPIVKNMKDSYHGYHTIDFYDVNEVFGTEAELIQLIDECHKRDIWVMVDVVANHVAPVGYDYKGIKPFNSPEHYHETCAITDWNNQPMVENCRLLDLPDLKHENEWVSEELLRWIKWLVNKYKIDGLRVDTIPEVPKWFWRKFTEASGVYTLGECFNGNPEYVGGYQGPMSALFNYPLYYTITENFHKEGNMSAVRDYLDFKKPKYKEPLIFGTFVENHDNERFLFKYPGQKNQFMNANVFSVLWEGIPVLYYGGEQYFKGGRDPLNRETLWGHHDEKCDMYIAIKKANEIRAKYKIWELDNKELGHNKNYYAFQRGTAFAAVFTNKDEEMVVDINVKFEEGTVLCDHLATEEICLTVNEGKIKVKMQGKPRAFVKKETTI